MDQPDLYQLGPFAGIQRVALEPQRIWSRIHHRYSLKRRQQAASTDIPAALIAAHFALDFLVHRDVAEVA